MSSMQHSSDCWTDPLEQAGYLEFHGAHIYSVLHGVRDPIARVLLVGPFASERYFSYVQWVRWARLLAAQGIETLRFDYRGVGESTGAFEDMSFRSWSEDVAFLAGWLNRRAPEAPLILHGLELGALLASRTFSSGLGDALLLWSTPANGNDVLRRPLARQVFKSVYERKPLSHWISELEADHSLEVEGYPWTGKLWRDSFEFTTPFGKGEEAAVAEDGRPVKLVKLDGTPAAALKGSSMGYIVANNLDLSGMFAQNLEWILEAVPVRAGRLQ